VIGSNRVTWCKLIWGIDRFTGQYVDQHIDRRRLCRRRCVIVAVV